MLKVKTESLMPIITALFFILLVIYMFSQDASLPGPF
jgi:hypothetical protein